MMKPVAILGTGPAGLLAGWAVARRGIPFVMIGAPSKDDPDKVARSFIGGAQFLHEHIEGIHDPLKPDGIIELHSEGDADTYRQKVYGDERVPFVSFTSGIRYLSAWRMEATYGWLWQELSMDRANVEVVDHDWVVRANEGEWFSAIVSTIPAPMLCHRGHSFTYQEIGVADYCILEDLPDNQVLYDGTVDRSWYRCARIFGHGSTEWSTTGPPPLLDDGKELVFLKKPIATNCDCHPEVWRAGRMGKWTKGVLAHEAYSEVRDALQ